MGLWYLKVQKENSAKRKRDRPEKVAEDRKEHNVTEDANVETNINDESQRCECERCGEIFYDIIVKERHRHACKKSLTIFCDNEGKIMCTLCLQSFQAGLSSNI